MASYTSRDGDYKSEGSIHMTTFFRCQGYLMFTAAIYWATYAYIAG
ncbi:MAG: hypothetical protein LUE63_08645 [Lachnospiraceae bacterium]|nr:hypothetical protein [Lachnospiraceae bacterium]